MIKYVPTSRLSGTLGAIIDNKHECPGGKTSSDETGPKSRKINPQNAINALIMASNQRREQLKNAKPPEAQETIDSCIETNDKRRNKHSRIAATEVAKGKMQLELAETKKRENEILNRKNYEGRN